MKLKLKTLFLASAIASPLTVLASEPTLVQCPGVEAIKQQPFTKARVDYWMGWIAFTGINKYDTQEDWRTGMIIGGNEGDEQAVLAEANSSLSLLQVNVKDPDQTQQGLWCFYADKIDNPTVLVYSVTMTEDDFGEKLAKVSKRFQGIQH